MQDSIATESHALLVCSRSLHFLTSRFESTDDGFAAASRARRAHRRAAFSNQAAAGRGVSTSPSGQKRLKQFGGERRNAYTYLPTYFQEVQHLTNSFTALKQAQAKFQEAKNSLDDITPERACTHSIDEHKHP